MKVETISFFFDDKTKKRKSVQLAGNKRFLFVLVMKIDHPQSVFGVYWVPPTPGGASLWELIWIPDERT